MYRHNVMRKQSWLIVLNVNPPYTIVISVSNINVYCFFRFFSVIEKCLFIFSTGDNIIIITAGMKNNSSKDRGRLFFIKGAMLYKGLYNNMTIKNNETQNNKTGIIN